MLYKYYSPEDYNFDALKDGYFWFSKASKLNDPNECDARWLDENLKIFDRISTKEKKSEMFDRFNAIMKNYGICCFSKDVKNENLWAHYAQNYEGFVIGFDENNIKNPHLWKPSAPIIKLDANYRKQLIGNDTKILDGKGKPICAGNVQGNDLETLFQILCVTKNEKYWSHEDEFRLLIGSVGTSQHVAGIEYADGGYKVKMPDAVVKEIYVGQNMSDDNLERIKEIAIKYGIDKIERVVRKKPLDLDFEEIKVK